MPFTVGTKVQNIETGAFGIIVDDTYKSCGADEVVVVYDGEQLGDMASVAILKDLGPEYARADLRKCGFGQKETCCIFLTTPRTHSGNPNDCQCERFGPLRTEIIENIQDRIAKRWPTEPYPKCQISK